MELTRQSTNQHEAGREYEKFLIKAVEDYNCEDVKEGQMKVKILTHLHSDIGTLNKEIEKIQKMEFKSPQTTVNIV